MGYILTKRYDDLEKLLASFPSNICADVFEISKEYLTRSQQENLANKLEQIATQKKANKTFEELVDAFLEEANTMESKQLAERQKEVFSTWRQKREEMKQAIENEISVLERKENVEKIKGEIESKKQLLWFFEEEDKLDLDIFKKQVFYPKRWFGKKKKPRVLDEHYVPPQIRRIN